MGHEDESTRPGHRRSVADLENTREEEALPANPPEQAQVRFPEQVIPTQRMDTEAATAPLTEPEARTVETPSLQIPEEPETQTKVLATTLRLIPTAQPNPLEEAEKLEERGQDDEAFEILAATFDAAPSDEVTLPLERLAKKLGRLEELAARAAKNLTTTDVAVRAALLGHLVYWYEQHLDRASEVPALVAELTNLDRTHPAVLRQAAEAALANGDVKLERELYLRALERMSRADEKVRMHVLLASKATQASDIARHHEAILVLDPAHFASLQVLERNAVEAGKHGEVASLLERQAEVAPHPAVAVGALFRLGALYENKLLKRDTAAEIYERLLRIEPAHADALAALERCYHAQRDWPNLARTLRTRAGQALPEDKAAILQLAADVYESKLEDFTSAIEVYDEILALDPKSRRTLSDLARVAERRNDWNATAAYRTRIAELAPTVRIASRELLELGHYLAAPLRDPTQARALYERAVTIDPSNAAAWEALQRTAMQANDEREVLRCLTERAKHTDGPRQRAALCVELAEASMMLGDANGAREAYEQAILADATNETAAAALLDALVAEGKVRDAAPLAELLVNAATRDGDDALRFRRLRTHSHVFLALADIDRAMASAVAALELRPDDPDAFAMLLSVCDAARDSKAVFAHGAPLLLRTATQENLLPPTLLVALAKLQRETDAIEDAVRTLERATKGYPDDIDILRELSDTHLSLGNFARAAELRAVLAQKAASVEQRFDWLVEAGEIWARRADDLESAAVVFEEARTLRPTDHWLLHTLMWIYSELGQWDVLSIVLEDIAKIQETPERKVKSLVAMAKVVEEKLGNRERAAGYLDQALDIDKTNLELFESLVRTLTTAKNWTALEHAYVTMIGRVKDDGNTALSFALFHQLGLIHRDRLGDASQAFEAFTEASRIRPDDTEVRKILTELLVVTNNVEHAISRSRELIEQNPHEPELFRELYELFLRAHEFDKAWCAVNVLATFDKLTPEQRQFHGDYPPKPVSDFTDRITEDAWHSHLLHPDLDASLTRLFAWLTPVVARVRFMDLSPELAARRPFTPNHTALYDLVRATFENGAEILGVPVPELVLGDPSNPMPFTPALVPFGAVQISIPALEARPDCLSFLVGKRLAEGRPELAARALFPSIPELTNVLGTAVRLLRNKPAPDALSARLDAGLLSVIAPHERAAICELVNHVTMAGGVVDAKRWLRAADLSSLRVGLFLACDVEPAKRVISAEPVTAADFPPRERLGELFKFATSDLYAELRDAVGIAIRSS